MTNLVAPTAYLAIHTAHPALAAASADAEQRRERERARARRHAIERAVEGTLSTIGTIILVGFGGMVVLVATFVVLVALGGGGLCG